MYAFLVRIKSKRLLFIASLYFCFEVGVTFSQLHFLKYVNIFLNDMLF